MKIAVSGKGGVGKTTVSALIIEDLASRDYQVLGIDADPDANLAAALAFDEKTQPRPIAELSDLVEERTGAKPGTVGGFFTLNPRVDDIPDRFSVARGPIRAMRMGTVKKGGAGCVCPESTLLRALVVHLLIERKEAVVLDMEAGIEHLGRGTATAVDQLVIVVEPGRRSVQTAEKIRELASDIALTRISVVGNKVRSEAEKDYLTRTMEGFNFLGFIPYTDALIEADMKGLSAYEHAPELRDLAHDIVSGLLETMEK